MKQQSSKQMYTQDRASVRQARAEAAEEKLEVDAEQEALEVESDQRISHLEAAFESKVNVWEARQSQIAVLEREIADVQGSPLREHLQDQMLREMGSYQIEQRKASNDIVRASNHLSDNLAIREMRDELGAMGDEVGVLQEERTSLRRQNLQLRQKLEKSSDMMRTLEVSLSKAHSRMDQFPSAGSLAAEMAKTAAMAAIAQQQQQQQQFPSQMMLQQDLSHEEEAPFPWSATPPPPTSSDAPLSTSALFEESAPSTQKRKQPLASSASAKVYAASVKSVPTASAAGLQSKSKSSTVKTKGGGSTQGKHTPPSAARAQQQTTAPPVVGNSSRDSQQPAAVTAAAAAAASAADICASPETVDLNDEISELRVELEESRLKVKDLTSQIQLQAAELESNGKSAESENSPTTVAGARQAESPSSETITQQAHQDAVDKLVLLEQKVNESKRKQHAHAIFSFARLLVRTHASQFFGRVASLMAATAADEATLSNSKATALELSAGSNAAWVLRSIFNFMHQSTLKSNVGLFFRHFRRVAELRQFEFDNCKALLRKYMYRGIGGTLLIAWNTFVQGSLVMHCNKLVDDHKYDQAIEQYNSFLKRYEHVPTDPEPPVQKPPGVRRMGSQKLVLERDTWIELHALYNNLGMVYDEAGETDMAEINYKKSIELNKNSSAAIFNLGVLCVNKQRYKEAIMHTAKVLQIEPQDQQCNQLLDSLIFQLSQDQNTSTSTGDTAQAPTTAEVEAFQSQLDHERVQMQSALTKAKQGNDTLQRLLKLLPMRQQQQSAAATAPLKTPAAVKKADFKAPELLRIPSDTSSMPSDTPTPSPATTSWSSPQRSQRAPTDGHSGALQGLGAGVQDPAPAPASESAMPNSSMQEKVTQLLTSHHTNESSSDLTKWAETFTAKWMSNRGEVSKVSGGAEAEIKLVLECYPMTLVKHIRQPAQIAKMTLKWEDKFIVKTEYSTCRPPFLQLEN